MSGLVSGLQPCTAVRIRQEPHKNDNRSSKTNPVPWMSGLVSGLQNHVRRFESARNLEKQKKVSEKDTFFFYFD